MEKIIHQGRNIKRFREMFGIKQETLAGDLGEEWTQKKVSLLEAKEIIEPDILEKVSAILKVPVEAIEKFDEDTAINVVSNTFTSQDTSTLNAINPYCTFNPIDKVVELFERLLASEREKTDLLKEILGKMK